MKVKVQTIVRTVLQGLCYIAVLITQFGLADTNNVAKGIVIAAAFGVTAWNFWKNNSFTDAAITADEIKDFLKENPDITFLGFTAKSDDDEEAEG